MKVALINASGAVLVAAVLILTGSAVAQKAKAPVVRQPTRSHVVQKASVSLIAKVKAPKSVSQMSLQEVEQFQVKALAHYTGMWNTWLKIKSKHRADSSPSGQWLITKCNGTRAPVWACWNLQARGWTKYELLKTRHRIYVRDHTIPVTTDWITAVGLVQRIYPGTADWLKYISHREGGWGRFVMNTQGSGAGGWMQFMSSTYYAYNERAFADARARGFIISEQANDWGHPLGQAITAGYMRYVGLDACHWCL